MVTIKNGTKLDEDLISHILNPSKPNIKFFNITFGCETIEDASGNVFVWACKRERKTGHWIRIAPRYYKCSECGVRANNSFANFCHRCGSYNGGDENV